MRSLIFRPRTWIVAAIVSWACPAFAQDPPTAAVVHIYSTRETVPASNTLKTSGLGAGFFITEDGDLLTAYHVIQGAVDVSIYTASGTECAGPKVVAYDEHRDLAHLKCIPKSGTVPVLQIDDHFEPLPVQGGIIYGHPNGKLNQRSPTSFPIERVITSDKYVVGSVASVFSDPPTDLIEIEAVLEQGMSGGPLLLRGKVIGVVSGGQQPNGGQLGWAIPAGGYRTLKSSTTTNFAQLPPLTLLRGGKVPVGGFLKVAIPQERFRALTESWPMLSEVKMRLGDLQSRMADARRDLEKMREKLRAKKRLSVSDIEDLDAQVWRFDHSTPYPGSRSVKRDLDAGRTPGGSDFLQAMSIVLGARSKLIVPVGEENQDIKKIAGPVRQRLDRTSGSSEAATAARQALSELEELMQRWVTKATDTAPLTELQTALDRLRTNTDKLISRRSGANAAAYIDDVIANCQSVARLVTSLAEVADLELQIVERSIEFESNALIMEVRLEPN